MLSIGHVTDAPDTRVLNDSRWRRAARPPRADGRDVLEGGIDGRLLWLGRCGDNQ